MRRLTLQRIQVFCAIYKNGSINVAAQQLGISQPTASRHLHDFEAALKVVLFERRQGRLYPTHEAHSLYEESRILNHGISRLERHVESMALGIGKQLSIATVSLYGREHLAYASERVLARFPDLNLKITIGLAEQQVALIREGRVDLGFVSGTVDAQKLYSTNVGRGRLVALVPEGSPHGEGNVLELAKLDAGTSMINMSPRGAIGHIVNEALASHGIVSDERIVSHSLDVLPFLAKQFNRLTIIDIFTARSIVLSGMRVVPIRPALTFDVNMLSSAPVRNGTVAWHFFRGMKQALQNEEV